MHTTKSSPLKIYTDASVFDGIASIGVVYCNHNGKPFDSYGRTIGKCGHFREAELFAMNEALERAPTESQHVISYTDCKRLSRHVHNPMAIEHVNNPEPLHKTVQTFDYFDAQYVPRENNTFAHMMAQRHNCRA